jgi:DNA-binding NtrC family response regulator
VRRIGDTRDREVDVRVIAATHTDLERSIADQRFREDLYFRLAHLPIEVPPLHRRREDVGLLFDHFVEHYWRRHRMRPRHVDDRVYPLLEGYPWPGNVRELKALCERLVVFGGDPITVGRLPREFTRPAATAPEVDAEYSQTEILPLAEYKRHAERAYIEQALDASGGNVSAAARALRISRTHLHQRITALGVRRPTDNEPSR